MYYNIINSIVITIIIITIIITEHNRRYHYIALVGSF